MENYDDTYTVEVKGPKGWEVIKTFRRGQLEEASEWLRGAGSYQTRVTTPVPVPDKSYEELEKENIELKAQLRCRDNFNY